VVTATAVKPLGLQRSRATASFILIALLFVAGGAIAIRQLRSASSIEVTEYPMLKKTDIPTAVATAPDGAVWFTIELSDAIGVLRDDRIQRLPKGTENLEPLGLGVDSEGAAWYTDVRKRAISRIQPDGKITSYSLSTPIVRLGRLAVGRDGSVWFTDATTASVTRLKDGQFTRYDVAQFRASPFAIAVDATGSVWTTLLEANTLLRVSPEGRLTPFDVPTPGSGLGDVAVDAAGAVWFVEARANKIGRFAGGVFTEFSVPTPAAGLTALAIAPDGSVWFTELRAQRLGRVRGDRVTEFSLRRRNARPFGIAVDAANNVWYTDLSGYLGLLAAARAN
jgi:virginiamycin B lyase